MEDYDYKKSGEAAATKGDDSIDKDTGHGEYHTPSGNVFARVFKQAFHRKPMSHLLEEAGSDTLKRSLGPFDLIGIGIGAIIGTGIFVLTGTAAANTAGPAVILSFVLAGIVAGLAALCYAELAAMVPVSGSAYTYTYASLGEFPAWMNGWSLILEYMVGSATVAVGWSAYLVSFVESISDYNFDRRFVDSPVGWSDEKNQFVLSGNYFNIPAFAIVLLICLVLMFGISQSAWVNMTVVLIKVSVIIIFIIAGATKINPDNWSPFIPANTGTFGKYGLTGILQAGQVVFFAYIGFDVVASLGQEAKKPNRDLPIGILGSLLVSTTLYILVCLVLTGMVSYTQLGVANPIAHAAALVGGLSWLSTVVSVGAVAGLTSVLMGLMIAQPRIFFAMACDGLMPANLGKVSQRWKVPVTTTWMTGIIVSVAAGCLPIDILGDLTSLGTLFAFLLVGLGVLVMRYTHPDAERKFRVPLGPFVIPILSIATTILLVVSGKSSSLLRMGIWMLLGAVIYFIYPRINSKLGQTYRVGGIVAH